MRDRLLPPNYSDLDVWKDLADAIDTVFKDRIDNPQKLFFMLRDTFLYRYTEYGQTVPHGLFDITDVFAFNKDEYIAVNDMLGFSPKYTTLTQENYQTISSNVAMYYSQKGTPAFADFVGYSLDALFNVRTMWTQNYVTFQAESSPGVPPGTPIYAGGTWYPTPYVTVTYDLVKFAAFSPYSVQEFFYYVAPINLVISVSGVTVYLVSTVDVEMSMAASVELYY